MVRPEIIRRRLQKLDEYLSVLERLQRYSEAEFLDEPEHYGATERFLQLSIETINDHAGHVVADEGWGVVDKARDLARLFRENDIIDSDIEQRWTQMIGFRNILVHDYTDIDRQIVYDVLQNKLGEIRTLQKCFIIFL